jgi:hypothetical protein
MPDSNISLFQEGRMNQDDCLILNHNSHDQKRLFLKDAS